MQQQRTLVSRLTARRAAACGALLAAALVAGAVLGGATDPPGDALGAAPPVAPPAAPAPPGLGSVAGPIGFDRQIRPILAEHCFTCHGPDGGQRKAELRLDLREVATAALPSGAVAIVPGNAAASALVARITAHAADERMPPDDTGKPLSAAQIAALTTWIEQGAQWEQHWSFVPPRRPEVPAVPPAPPGATPEQRARLAQWPVNPIDNFVLAGLAERGMSPAPEAEPGAWLRRVALDLVGLPPTPEELQAFLAALREAAPEARHGVVRAALPGAAAAAADAGAVYDAEVSRLFASPRYGERMALDWLDAARYADTHGYHFDNERTMWPWRDWVVNAFNANLPWDEFVIEQLAGDLLPDATLAQRIATGFNRNHPINWEGGIIPEEFLNEYVVDRVGTTATVFMGLTLACARCHDHKFDPFTQREFYEFYDFFHQVPEKGQDGLEGNAEPLVRVPDAATEALLDAQRAREAELTAWMESPRPELEAAERAWIAEAEQGEAGRWSVLTPFTLRSQGGATLALQPDGSVFADGVLPDKEVYELTAFTQQTEVVALRVEALADERLPRGGPGRASHGNIVLSGVELEIAPLSSPGDKRAVTFTAAHADWSQKGFPVARAIDGKPDTGWALDGAEFGEDRIAVFVAETPFGFPEGTALHLRLRQESTYTQHALGRFRISVTTRDREALAPSRAGTWFASAPFTAEDNAALFAQAFAPEAQCLANGGAADLAARDEHGAPIWTAHPEWADREQHSLLSPEPTTVSAAAAAVPGAESDAAAAPAAAPAASTADAPPSNAARAARYLYRAIESPDAREATLALGSDDALAVWCNGVGVLSNPVARSLAADQDRVRLPLRAGTNHLLLKVANYGGDFGFTCEVLDDNGLDVPLGVASILARAPAERSAAQLGRVREHIRSAHSEEWRAQRAARDAARSEIAALERAVPTTMVMGRVEMPRETRILLRGAYDQFGETVTAGVPAILPPLRTATDRAEPEPAPAPDVAAVPAAAPAAAPAPAAPDRLALARWLVDPGHPLTARVAVNRLWQMCFGRGLVATPEDFGTQGSRPSHPELLDWLAVELVESGWDVQHVLRLIVTSATYRQSAAADAAARAADPEGLWLGRAPRVRLSAELLRDQALFVSGLLVERLGGPPVKPYQPAGLWEEIGSEVAAFSANTYVQSHGEDLYRRSLYTFRKRSMPPPSMTTFDSPTREACTVRRSRTNTPLQALVLLNDPTFVEAARMLATRVLREEIAAAQGGSEAGAAAPAARDGARLRRAVRRVLLRDPDAAESDALLALLDEQRAVFAADPAAAGALLAVGESALDATLPAAELASWTVLCSVLLNLDETITRS